jgi:hypothetical protein
MWIVVKFFQHFQVLKKGYVHIFLQPILGINNSHGIQYRLFKKLNIQLFNQPTTTFANSNLNPHAKFVQYLE